MDRRTEMEKNHKSICYVQENADWLFRLADIDEYGNIEPFRYDGVSKWDRDGIYNRSTVREPKTIGIFEWSCSTDPTSNDKVFFNSTHLKNETPTQIVYSKHSLTIDLLLNMLISGWITCHVFNGGNLFLSCSKPGQRNTKGIFLRENQWIDDNGIIKLKPEVEVLEVMPIIETNIAHTKHVDLYEFNEDDKDVDYICAKSPDSVIKSILLERASWGAVKKYEVTKSAWRDAKKIIEGFESESIIDCIASKLVCDESKAKQYYDTFLNNLNSYFSGKDFDQDIFDLIVDNNELIRETAVARYTEKHKDAFTEFENKLKDAESALNDKNALIADLDAELNAKKDNLDELEAKIHNNERELTTSEELIASIEQSMSERLENAKNNISEFVSEIGFISSSINFTANVPAVSVPVTPLSVSPSSEWFRELEAYNEDELDYMENMSEIKDLIVSNLQVAGVNKMKAWTVCDLLCSSYFSNIPLLFVGPGALSISECLSVSVWGEHPAFIDCNTPYSVSSIDIIQKSQAHIVVLNNPLNTSWMEHIEDLNRIYGKRFILTAAFGEDLLSIPQSFYNYVFPILTDNLLNNIPDNDFYPGKLKGEFKPFSDPKGMDNLLAVALRSLNINAYTKARFKKLIEGIGSSAMNIPSAYIVTSLLFSYAYATDCLDNFKQRLVEFRDNLDNGDEKILREVLGDFE